jgi:hypothetical protein
MKPKPTTLYALLGAVESIAILLATAATIRFAFLVFQ